MTLTFEFFTIDAIAISVPNLNCLRNFVLAQADGHYVDLITFDL